MDVVDSRSRSATHLKEPSLPSRSWKPILGLLIGVALLGRAWWIDRGIGWLPLSVPSATVLARPLDTTVVLPGTGRYELAHEFIVPEGGEPIPPLDSGMFVEFDGAVAGRRWSTSESGSTAGYGVSDGTQGYVAGTVAGKRGDTLRLSLRVSPALAKWMSYSPTLQVRRRWQDEMYLPIVRDLTAWAGAIVIALSALAYWLSARVRVAAPTDRP